MPKHRDKHQFRKGSKNRRLTKAEYLALKSKHPRVEPHPPTSPCLTKTPEAEESDEDNSDFFANLPPGYYSCTPPSERQDGETKTETEAAAAPTTTDPAIETPTEETSK